jgi:hypothetical protein
LVIVGTKDGKIIRRIYNRTKKSLWKFGKFEDAYASNPLTRKRPYG